MKKNFLRLAIISCAVIALLLALPSYAQDDWLGGCQLPDLDEAMRVANDIQVNGDELAYLNRLRDIADAANDSYASCLGEIVRSGDDMVNADLSYANLQAADLAGANLQGANLWGANLREANLQGANLRGATLWSASLQTADLTGADLRDANLGYANLHWADLEGTQLEGANLFKASFVGADLERANLQGATLSDATFDETTILPDGYCSAESFTCDGFWSPDTDLTRFIDPEHADFWNPCVELDEPPWYCEKSDG
jgi:uncharacterized protein YjbI with pentapeptide repeats